MEITPGVPIWEPLQMRFWKRPVPIESSDKVPIDFSDCGRRLLEGDYGLCGKAAELWMANCV